MTVIDETAPSKDAGIRRDRWGRYLLPHPDTGIEQAWTRVTTLAGTLADRYGLERWDQRNVVLGIGARRDLYAQAAAATPDDVDTLNNIVTQAKEASKAKAGANMGFALHRLTERVDTGDLDPSDIDDPTLRADVEAYALTMRLAGITVVPGWTEQVLLIPELDLAGTCDRLCNGLWSLPRIGDVKTGKDVVRWGMAEIPLQCACYAHATHWYDTRDGTLHDMPKVDLQRAIVMHLPAGKATCLLYEIDIKAGWEAVQTAVAVRDWRKRKDLAEQIPTMGEGTQLGAAPPPTVRVAWVKAWIAAIGDAGNIDQLALLWPDGVHPNTGWSNTDIDKIAAVCVKVDAADGKPFWPPDPTSEQRKPT